MALRKFALVFAVLFVALEAHSQTCPSSCPTRDDVVVQKLLNAAAAAGGGTVQLKPGIYYTCRPLIIGSNVHLRGAGRGATIIRGSAVIEGETVDHAYVASSIATVGTNNVSVSDLTIDHATCGRNANGISFLPTGTSSDVERYDGTVPTNGLVERVEVLGAPGYHNYMIWNLKGRHMKIVDNWVDGGADSVSPQEGIESFGGYDVMIANNTVKNIGSACINLGSAGLVNSETVGVFAVNNYLSGCTVGVNLGTSEENGGQSNSHTHIRGNVITDSRITGIDIPVAVNTTERDLQISGNTIRNITGNGVAGIRLRSSGSRIGSAAVIATTVEGNHIDNVTGINAVGIFVLSYPDVRILNNTIVDTSNEGIFVYESNDVEVVGNRIERSGTVPIGIYQGTTAGIDRFVIQGNKLLDWPSLNSAILVLGGRFGIIQDNTFSRTDTAQPAPITVEESCGVQVSGNVPWYYLRWSGAFTSKCPGS